MHVKIGPYLTWWGPYQIADLVFGNPPKYIDEDQRTWRHRWSERFGDWLSETWVAQACSWVDRKRKRNIYVSIDDYDVWSMDETLRLIIAPMLVKLKAQKHGSGNIDDKDVPEHLQSTAVPKPANEWDIDDNFHARYAWLLDELIWVFSTDHEEALNGFVEFTESKTEPGLKRLKLDDAGLREYNARVSKAYRLFGKYYQTLWD
jgi:hypothetical protein